MGNKANRMAICSRKDQPRPQTLHEFSSFVSVTHEDSDLTQTCRSSIFDNPDNVSLEDFTLLKVLGSGAFGKVFLVEKKTKSACKKNKQYAMKVLRKNFIIAKAQCAHTMTERRILEQIQSPFIVKLAYAF